MYLFTFSDVLYKSYKYLSKESKVIEDGSDFFKKKHHVVMERR